MTGVGRLALLRVIAGDRPRASRASASRMAPTTAATVSSNVLPSVVMIRASGATRSGATARVRVESIAPAERLEDRLALRSVRIEAALLGPAPGALLDRGVEVHLEVRVGQHDRADVAAGHHDPAVARERRAGGRGAPRGRPGRPRPRTRPRRPPGRGHRRCRRRRRLDDPRQPARRRRRRARAPRRAPTRPSGIVAADTPRSLGEPRDRAIQQPRVEEAVAEPPAPRRRRRCSCPTSPAHRARRRALRSLGSRPSGRRGWRRPGRCGRPAVAAGRPGRERPPPAPSPRISGALSGRTAPLRRPSIRTGPIRTRTSRSTGAPTAPNIRRSWRFQPCVEVARYQASGGGGGRMSATRRCTSAAVIARRPAQVGQPLVELDALP